MEKICCGGLRLQFRNLLFKGFDLLGQLFQLALQFVAETFFRLRFDVSFFGLDVRGFRLGARWLVLDARRISNAQGPSSSLPIAKPAGVVDETAVGFED